MRERREITDRDVGVGRKLYEAGLTLRDFRFIDGHPLLHSEMRALHQRCYPHDAHSTGRKSTVDHRGEVSYGDYECHTCLAGSVFLASPEKYYGKIPIVLPNDRCTTKSCKSRSTIKSGAGYDGIVMVLPDNKIHNVFNGEWPVDVLGSMLSWSEDYLYAVRASEVFSLSATPGKVNATYGEKFRAKSRFQETVMFLCRMRGIQDVAFYHCFENSKLFEQLEVGHVGAVEDMRKYFAATIDMRVNHMTHYAWGLYELCKLGVEFPKVQIPLKWFCANMNRVSRNTRKAVLSMQQEYERQQLEVRQDFPVSCLDDQGNIVRDIVCADCQIHYGCTEVVGTGFGVQITNAQLLRVSANLEKLSPDVRRPHAMRLPVSRPGCLCMFGLIALHKIEGSEPPDLSCVNTATESVDQFIPQIVDSLPLRCFFCDEVFGVQDELTVHVQLCHSVLE